MRVGALISLLLSLASAQDRVAQCQRKMERCWIANNGGRAGSLETTKDSIEKSKQISQARNNKLFCGWQIGTKYMQFVFPPGQGQQCEIAKRGPLKDFFQPPCFKGYLENLFPI